MTSPQPAAPPTTRHRRFSADLYASVTVFLIALPLSLGIALTSGAPLQAGLVAAAVGGIVAGRFGGSPLLVTGPAAGLTIVTADLIQSFGWRTTCALTVLAGLTQIALGRLRVARFALVVSPAVVHGMLAGIGLSIAAAQVHIVLGGSPGSSALHNLATLPAAAADAHPADLAVGAVTVAVLVGWPQLRRLGRRPGRLVSVLPPALAAVGLATALAVAAGLRVPHVDLPSWRSHALPELPDGPVLALLAGVLTVTLVAGVQTLLAAVAIDKLASGRTGGDRVPRSDLDRELRGLGLANVVSGGLGGMPVAGLAVRSSANVASGAVSRRSTMLHGLWMALAAGLLVGVLDVIPLAALAGLVMVVGARMVKITQVRTVRRHREIVVYAVTTLGVVAWGVLEGVAAGMAAALLLALHRLSRAGFDVDVTHGPSGVSCTVRVHGRLTFLAVPRLSRVLAGVPPTAAVVVRLDGHGTDHAVADTLHEWRAVHEAGGGTVRVTGSGDAFPEDRATTALVDARVDGHSPVRQQV